MIPVAHDVIHVTCDVISKLCGSGNLLLSRTVLLNAFRNVPVLSTLIITILLLIIIYYVPFWGSIYHPLFKASAVLVKDKLTILTKTGFSILDDFQNQVLRIEFQELGFKNQTLFKGTRREISKQVKTSQRKNNSVE